jgi:hypothetical protein
VSERPLVERPGDVREPPGRRLDADTEELMDVRTTVDVPDLTAGSDWSLILLLNNVVADGPCLICGVSTAAWGLDLAVDTGVGYAPVCDPCGHRALSQRSLWVCPKSAVCPESRPGVPKVSAGQGARRE